MLDADLGRIIFSIYNEVVAVWSFSMPVLTKLIPYGTSNTINGSHSPSHSLYFQWLNCLWREILSTFTLIPLLIILCNHCLTEAHPSVRYISAMYLFFLIHDLRLGLISSWWINGRPIWGVLIGCLKWKINISTKSVLFILIIPKYMSFVRVKADLKKVYQRWQMIVFHLCTSPRRPLQGHCTVADAAICCF